VLFIFFTNDCIRTIHVYPTTEDALLKAKSISCTKYLFGDIVDPTASLDGEGCRAYT